MSIDAELQTRANQHKLSVVTLLDKRALMTEIGIIADDSTGITCPQRTLNQAPQRRVAFQNP
jgi:hypothetical protein